MKRYLLFAYWTYYPRGGWLDFVGSFDTQEEAESAALANKKSHWHIIDANTGEEVAEG